LFLAIRGLRMPSSKAFYLLYGPPASGKTYLALKLQREHGFHYLSVGEITRREIASDSTEGRQLKYYLDNVLEYPPELISGVLRMEIARVPRSCKHVFLDGFPKYDREVKSFLKMLADLAIRLVAIVLLECPLAEVLRRVSQRRMCRGCGRQCTANRNARCPHCNGDLVRRDDDEPIVLQRRYRDYTTSIAETLEFLKACEAPIVRISATESRRMVYTLLRQRLSL
jgi:adenylate kinase